MCGSSPAPAPTSTTNTTTSIPDYAKPYVEGMLGKAAAVTTNAMAPGGYQAYGQERQAGFTPMQQQAFTGAQNMQAPQQTADASNIAAQTGLAALGTHYQGGQFQGGQFGQQDAQQYMSPYMQSVVDVQQREAQRQADIAGTQRNAQAVGAGAFGGSRQAIMDAEAARNLATQQGGIQAAGQQAAFQQAQSQYNADQSRRMQAQQLGEQSRQYGAGLGMQGLQTAGQMAGQLGALGQQQYQQGVGINQLQQQYGTQQQQQQQAALTQQYQDFLNQKQDPYKQLGFMSDMLRGLPMSNSAMSQYTQPPSALNQLAGAGTAMYGASRLMGMAKGGAVKKRPAGLAELAIHNMV